MHYRCLCCWMAGGCRDAESVTCVLLCVFKSEQGHALNQPGAWRKITGSEVVCKVQGPAASRERGARWLQGPFGACSLSGAVALVCAQPGLCCRTPCALLECRTGQTVIPEATSPDLPPQLSVRLT